MDEDLESGSESASTLRSRLAETAKANRELETELRTLRADKLISEKGYKLVSSADLSEVPLGDLEARATEIEARKQVDGENAMKAVLRSRGYSEEEVETSLLNLLGTTQGELADAQARLRTVTTTSGSIAPIDNRAQLTGPDRIRWALENNKL